MRNAKHSNKRNYKINIYIDVCVCVCVCVCVYIYTRSLASKVALVVKNPMANSEDMRDVHSVPRLGRSPGVRASNPLQYSCLENPIDKGAWQA